MRKQPDCVSDVGGGSAPFLRLPVLLFWSFLAVTLFQGTRGLYETTEGRYAECGREMAQRGRWLEPVLNGKPHWTKPPLTYVAIGAPYKVLGPTSWAARLYLIPCYLISIWAAWLLALRLWRDRATAQLCAMTFATSAVPMFASNSVCTDYPLATAVLVTQACFWEAFRFRSQRAVYLVWLCLGIAFLVKGPPSLLYLPAMIVTWLRIPKAERSPVSFFSPVGIALFLFVGFGWYAWEAWQHPGLMQYWLHDEVVDRSLTDKFNRNPQFYKNFEIYAPILLFGTLPWSGWLVFRWRQVWQRVRGLVPAGVSGVRGVLASLPDEVVWVLWSVLFPACVFAVSRSKLPYYVLPLLAPMALCVGKLMMSVYRGTPWFRKAVLVTWAVALLAFVVGKGAYAYYPSKRNMAQFYEVLQAEPALRDPSRFAFVGDKHLNGLSYYYDTVLNVVSVAELSAWLASGEERYLISNYIPLEQLRKVVPGREVVEVRCLANKWRLYRVEAVHPAGKK